MDLLSDRLVLRRVALAIAAAACIGSAWAQQPAMTVFVQSGTAPGAGFGSAVTVSPSSVPAAVARELATRPAGARAILLTGFADDLTSRDTVVVPSVKRGRGRVASPAVNYPSPWLDTGASLARQRATSWIAGYKVAGGVQPDFVVIRCRASMSASSYLARTSSAGWNAVASDRRFPALAAAIGVPDLRTKMQSSLAAQQAWDRYFERTLDAMIHSSLAQPLSQAYPGLSVCMEDRYSAPAGLATVSARSGVAALPQQIPFTLRTQGSAGFAAFAAVVGDLWRVRGPGSAVPSLPAPGSVQWLPAGANSALPVALQAEVARQLAAAGFRAAWSPSAGWMSAEGQAVAAAVRESNAQLGPGAPARSASAPAFDPTMMLVTGSVRNGIASWRVSMADGVQLALATFADGGTMPIARSAGTGGAWLSHPESRRLLAVDVAAQPTASTGDFVLLSDDVPPNLPGAIAARPYMIIYQGVDPQSYSSGRMDSARIVSAVAQEFAAGRGSPWGVLDFEEPFNEIMDHGPSDPRFAGAMASLVETLRAVKASHPAVRWTYYNFPRIPYWNSNRDWAALGASERLSIQDGISTKYAPLMDELDWFMPSIYDRYERSRFDASMLPLITMSESSFRDASVEFLRRYMSQPGKTRRPIIPMASPWFIEGGRATQYRAIPAEELIGDQLRPAIDAGADGIALWCATDWLSTLATRDGADFPEYARIEQIRVRQQFAADFVAGGASPAFDWTSPANAAMVRARLSAIVTNAIVAVNRAVADRDVAAAGTAPSAVASLVRQ
jgi:hypothetical protein